MLYSKRISIIYSIVIVFMFILFAFLEESESILFIMEAASMAGLLLLEIGLPPILKGFIKKKQSKFEILNSETYIKNDANYIAYKILLYGMPFFTVINLKFWYDQLYDDTMELLRFVLAITIFHIIWRIIKSVIILPYYIHLKKNVKCINKTIKIYQGLIKGELPDLNKQLILFINHGKSRSTQGVNHLYFKGSNNTYLLNEDEILRILRNKPEHKRLLSELISCYCYLLEPSSKEEYYNELDQIYEDVFVKSAGGFNKQVIIFNYSDQEEPINIPSKFKTISAIKFCPITSTEEITEVKIRILLEKEQGNIERNTDLSTNMNMGNLLHKDDPKDTTNFKVYFENSNYFLDQINCYGEYNTQFQFENDELRNFFNSAVTFQNPIQSIMALIDYIEIILRLSAYYYGKKEFDKTLEERIEKEGPQGKKRLYHELLNNNTENKKRMEIIPSDLFSIGYEIWKAVKEEDPLYQSIHHKSYRYSKMLQPIFNAVGDFIYANFEGYMINFLGLVRTVNHIRNKVIAHGSLQTSILYPVWCMLFYSAVALTEFLGIEDMKIDFAEGTYWVSYIGNDKKISMGNLVVNRNNYPCLAWDMQLKETSSGFKYSLKYINFFEGEMIKPEHFSENFDL